MELPLAAITSCLSYSKLVFRMMQYWFQARGNYSLHCYSSSFLKCYYYAYVDQKNPS